jgi:hypothetical protein
LKLVAPLKEQLFYFMQHKNRGTKYRKIEFEELIMNNSCSSKQWVNRSHMDVLIKIEIGSPLLKNNYSTSCHIKMEILIIGE